MSLIRMERVVETRRVEERLRTNKGDEERSVSRTEPPLEG